MSRDQQQQPGHNHRPPPLINGVRRAGPPPLMGKIVDPPIGYGTARYSQRVRSIRSKVPNTDRTSTTPVQRKRPRLNQLDESRSASSGISMQQSVPSASEEQRMRPANTTPVTGNRSSTTIINNETKPRCQTCHVQFSEHKRMHQEISDLRKTISEMTDEKMRLIEEANIGQQYRTERAQVRLKYERDTKKLNAQLVLTTRERDDLLASLVTERANSKALMSELEEERAKSTAAVATALESMKKMSESSQFDPSDDRMDLEQPTVEDAGIAQANEAFVEQRKQSTTNTDDLQQTPAPVKESQADDSLDDVNRQLQHMQVEVFEKSDGGQNELVENLRKSNKKLCKTRNELRRMKEDAELRVLRLDEINQGHTEMNAQQQARIEMLESEQKSQRNYQKICTHLLHLTAKYQKNAGEFAQQHGDPPESREKLKACLEHVMEQFMLEAAQAHNSEMTTTSE